jgi:acetyl esterase/lipase
MPRLKPNLANVLTALVVTLLLKAIFIPWTKNADAAGAQRGHGALGEILRVWPLQGGVRPGYKGYRVLYRSTGHDGAPVAVSGAILFPADAAPGRLRDVIAWAHPTTGVTTKCAPTLLPDLSGSIPGIDRFLDQGYVIVATDYIGLGADGDHPYLVGDLSAYAIIDSVRAALRLKDTQAGNRFVVWGHSQGGHAALVTAQYAAAYAPELQLVGAAAAAPATDLIALFMADRETASGRSLTAMALHSWSRVYRLPIDDYVEPVARHHFDTLAQDCIQTISDYLQEERDEQALERQFLKVDPVQHPQLRSIMAHNSTGSVPSHIPVFIGQGTADTLVRPNITRAYIGRICAAGARVKLHMIQGGEHMFAGRDSAEAAVQWIAARFQGKPPPSDC